MARRSDRLGLVAAGALVAVLTACGSGGANAGGDAVARGEALFRGEATCAVCHGPDLRGTPMGPALLDQLYGPDHHPDDAIRAAVRNGVQPHHWDFGPMPALTHLDDSDIDDIIAFVRREQQDAGGTERP